jgi:hypothetical protein
MTRRLSPARVWNASQSWYFEALHEHGDTRIRIRIRRNAYDNQSFLIAEVWSPTTLSWNEATTLPMNADRQSHSVQYFQEKITVEHFARDERDLLHTVSIILS